MRALGGKARQQQLTVAGEEGRGARLTHLAWLLGAFFRWSPVLPVADQPRGKEACFFLAWCNRASLVASQFIWKEATDGETNTVTAHETRAIPWCKIWFLEGDTSHLNLGGSRSASRLREVGIHEMLRAQTLTTGSTCAVQTRPAVIWSVLLTGGPPAAG